jgi:hypothetical protein
MSWLHAAGAVLGGLGTLLGALNARRAMLHRRRLEQLERAHAREHPSPRFLQPPR